MWFIIKNTLYKNKYCVLPIVPWENGKRKGEKTIQNLYFFIMVKWGKKERKVKKMADFMHVFLLCAVCTDAENEENSAVDRR